MNIEEMDRLLNVKDKSKSSKADQEAFSREWLSYVEEHGFDSNAEEYLYSGFSFKGMTPFLDYLIKSNNKIQVMDSLLLGNLFYSNNTKTFKMALHLLAQLVLRLPDEKALIGNLVKILPELAVNRNQKRSSDTVKSVQKYFISMLEQDTILPNLNELGIRPARIKMFQSMMQEALVIDTSNKSDQHNTLQNAIVKEWLDSYTADVSTAGMQIGVSENGIKENALKDGVDEPTIVESPATTEHSDCGQPCTKMEKQIITWNDGINVIIRTLKSLENEVAILKSENSSLRSRYQILDEENGLNILKLKEEREIINRHKSTIGTLREDIGGLKTQIHELQRSIGEKEVEITNSKRMTEILRKDDAMQNSELIRRLSGELKSYREDFYATESVIMTIELGEGLRDQLRDIFNILKNRGMLID